MKGQGNVEYLVTFATIVAFTVALVSLMSYFTENSKETQQSSSFNYWAGFYPFSVKEWRQYPNGTLTIYFKNVGLRTMVFYNMSVDGKAIGQKQKVPINGVFEVSGNVTTCQENDLVRYDNITIYYRPVGNVTVLKKKSTVPIIILCK